jgi:putative transposase
MLFAPLNLSAISACRVLAHDFKFASELNSQARQVSAEKAWSSISRFFDNCKKKVIEKKGYP